MSPCLTGGPASQRRAAGQGLAHAIPAQVAGKQKEFEPTSVSGLLVTVVGR